MLPPTKTPRTMTSRKTLYSSSLSRGRGVPPAVTPTMTTTPSLSQGPSTNDTTTTTPNDENFFLCWGSSIGVNEDLRRALRAECEEINGCIEQLMGKQSAAKATHVQLDKDLKHAHAEMVGTRRSVANNKQVEAVNEELRLKLGQVLESTGLLPPNEEEHVVVTPNKDKPTTRDNTNDEEKDGNEDDSSSNKDSNSNNSDELLSYLADAKQKEVRVSKSVQTLTSSYQRLHSHLKEIQEDEIKVIYDRIQKEGLEKQLESAEKEEQEQHEEKNQLELSNRTKQAALQTSKAACSEYKEQIASHTKSLETKKSDNEKTESNLLKKLEAQKKQLDVDGKELKEYLERENLIIGQLARLEQDLALAESIRITKAAKMDQHRGLVAEVKDLEAEAAKLLEEHESAQSLWDRTTVALKETRERVQKVNRVKEQNDKVQAQQETEGQAEWTRLLQEKEHLAQDMVMVEKESIESAEKTKAELVKYEEEINGLDTELTRVQKDVQVVLEQSNQAETALAENEKALQTELEELADESSNLESEVSAKQNELNRLKIQAQVERESYERRDELDAIYQVLLVGKELEESTQETEKRLLQEPLEDE